MEVANEGSPSGRWGQTDKNQVIRTAKTVLRRLVMLLRRKVNNSLQILGCNHSLASNLPMDLHDCFPLTSVLFLSPCNTSGKNRILSCFFLPGSSKLDAAI
jgi:hypothetical protein